MNPEYKPDYSHYKRDPEEIPTRQDLPAGTSELQAENSSPVGNVAEMLRSAVRALAEMRNKIS